VTITNKFTGGSNPNKINPTVLGQYATYADLPDPGYFTDLTLAYVRDSKTLYQVQSGAWVASSSATGISRVTATVDPTVSDDITLGYAAGSLWERTDEPKLFICTDPTEGAAVWVSLWRATDLDSYGSKVTTHDAPGSALTLNLSDSNVHVISNLTGDLAVSFDVAGRVTAAQSTELTVIVQTGANTVSFPDVVGSLPAPSGSTWDVYRFIVAYLGGAVVYLARLSGGYSPGGAVADTTAPALPTSFTATPGTTDGTLTWVDPADADLDHINVYKGTVSGGPYALEASVAAGTQTWTDSAMDIGTDYFYVLTAVDATGNESAQTTEATMVLLSLNLWTDPTLASEPTATVGSSTITHTTKSFGEVGSSVNVVEWHQVSTADMIYPWAYREITVTPGQPVNISLYYTSDLATFAKFPLQCDVDGVTYYAYSDGTWSTTSNELTPVFSGDGVQHRWNIQMDPIPAGTAAFLKMNPPYRGGAPFDAEVSGVQVTMSSALLAYQGGAAVGPTQSATYTVDSTTDFSNPERGLFSTSAESNPTPAAPWNAVAPDMRLKWWILHLDSYRSTFTLPTSFLDSIEATLTALRSTDVKAIIRPVYNYDSSGTDAPIATVLNHISQLGAVFTTYADVIAWFQAGFIGAYGEWHDSTNDLVFGSDGSGKYRDQIHDAMLANFPSSRMIQFRTPRIIGPSDISNPNGYGWETTILTPAQFFDASDQARTALFNDCFLVDQYNGSWEDPWDGTSTAQDTAIAEGITAGTPVSGETCGTGLNAYNTGAAALAAIERLHWDSLHASYSTTIYNKWNSDGYLAEISRTMGYRYAMTSVTAPRSAAAGDTINISLAMQNNGTGKLVNARPMKLVLRPTGGGSDIEITMLSDCRSSMPLTKASGTLSLTAAIPGGTAAGDYTLHIKMPDASANLSSRVGSMIRFANVGTWDGATGVNSLGLTLTIA